MPLNGCVLVYAEENCHFSLIPDMSLIARQGWLLLLSSSGIGTPAMVNEAPYRNTIIACLQAREACDGAKVERRSTNDEDSDAPAM